ncbi:alpha/beta hydrolase fold domain-containing protein [Nonomuraea sp. NPDC050663]|uniref:alpha/beta hydrolase fold domain-containing protein n=1 Tax=Nonomuraea sp. NPDC050663 TaxID=3364370 RepID=UPI0037993E54
MIHRSLIVAEHRGFRPLMLDLVVPDKPGPHPVLLYMHGGGWLGGSPRIRPGWWGEHDPIAQAVAAGFAVALVEYRMSAEAVFPAQLDDVRAALAWVREHGAAYDLSGRIGTWGESAGGQLAALVALTDPGIGAAVGWYPVTNLLSVQAQTGPGSTLDHDAADSPESLLIGAPVQEAPDLARAASPVSYAHAGAAPTLLVHGDADRLVPWRQSQELAEALTETGAQAELLIVRGADHCFVGADLGEPIRASLDFFVRHLTG